MREAIDNTTSPLDGFPAASEQAILLEPVKDGVNCSLAKIQGTRASLANRSHQVISVLRPFPQETQQEHFGNAVKKVGICPAHSHPVLGSIPRTSRHRWYRSSIC